MIKYCNKKKLKVLFFKRKISLVFFAIILWLVAILMYLNYVVNPVIIESSVAKTRAMSQRAVEEAMYDILTKCNVYEALVTISRNEQGEIDYISANSLQINILARELTQISLEKLETMGAKGINIPIGSFTGLPILVGRGPEINVKLSPIGSLTAKFASEFISAGINQTNHKLFLTVETNLSIILPVANHIVKTQTQMLIAESVIVGKIPEVYLQSNSLDNMLDLVP